jgi:ribonucleotide monophosphatase NagD (HAD superfamily)
MLSSSAITECSSNLPIGPKMPYDSVVVGLAPSLLDYNGLTAAFRILIGEHDSQRSSSPERREIPLLATHKARYIRTPDGQLSLGPGPFVAALEAASGVKAEVVGKPTKAFFESVIESMNLAGKSLRMCMGVL